MDIGSGDYHIPHLLFDGDYVALVNAEIIIWDFADIITWIAASEKDDADLAEWVDAHI